MNNIKLEPDSPKESISKDCFERGKFAHDLAYLLRQKGEQSTVVAIEASWGEGKTTTINFIREQIEEQDKHVEKQDKQAFIVDFQPWLFRYERLDDLVRSFIKTLVVEISTKQLEALKLPSWLDKIPFATATLSMLIVRLFRRMIPFATVTLLMLTIATVLWFKHKIPFAITTLTMVIVATFLRFKHKIPFVQSSLSVAINAIQKFGEKYGIYVSASTQSLKKDIDKLLSKIKHPIVVIIDDVDRLQPNEIRMVFQLIKSICNFNGINYLVAYEKSPVVKALSYDDIYDGSLYLEKIVQVPYKLPIIGKYHMRCFYMQEMDRLLQSLNLNLSKSLQKRMEQLKNDRSIINMLKNPRDMHRLINQLKLIIPATHKEVDLVDVIIFHILSLKIPEVTDLIRKFPSYFVFNYEGIRLPEMIIGRMENKDKPTYASLVEKIELSENEKNDAMHVLKLLFHRQPQDQNIAKDTRDLRINIANNLQKLLHIGNNDYSSSAKDAIAFLESPEERTEIFQKWLKSEFWQQFMYELIYHIDSTSDIDIDSLTTDLISFSLQMCTSIDTDPTPYILYMVLNKSCTIDEQFAHLNILMGNSRAITLSAHVLQKYLNNNNKTERSLENKVNLTEQQLTTLKNIWLETVREKTKQGDWIVNEPSIISVLFMWGQLSTAPQPYIEVQNYLKEKLEKDGFLTIFIDKWSQAQGDHFDSLEKIIPEETYNIFSESKDPRAKKMSDYLEKKSNIEE